MAILLACPGAYAFDDGGSPALRQAWRAFLDGEMDRAAQGAASEAQGPHRARALKLLGQLRLAQGHREAAREHWRQALAAARGGEDWELEGDIVNDLALVCEPEGCGAALLEEALGLFTRAGSPVGQAATLANLARLDTDRALLTGEKEARVRAQARLDQAKRTLHSPRPSQAALRTEGVVWNNQGRLWADLESRPKEALEAFTRAARALEQTGPKAQLAIALANRGILQARLASQKGGSPLDAALALQDITAAMDMVEGLRGGLSSLSGRSALFAGLRDLYSNAISILLALGDGAGAFTMVERARERALLDALGSQGAVDAAARRSPEVRALVEQERLLAEMAMATLDPEAMDRAYRRRQEVLARLRELDPLLIPLVSVHPPPLSRLQGILGQEGATLVEYHLQGDLAVAFVVTAGGIRVVRLALDQGVTAFEDGVSLLASSFFARSMANQLDPFWQDPLAHLYRQLVAPLALPPGPLVVVAPEPLSLLPWGALVVEPDRAFEPWSAIPAPRFLIQDREVWRVPSASALVAEVALREARAAEPEPPLALLMGLSQAEGLVPLPRAIPEVREVSRILRPGRPILVRTGRLATAKAFLDRARGASLIHLATHATLDRHKPWRSAVRLHDRAVTAREIVGMHLRARVVFLAACDSAAEARGGATDPAGLGRAFLLAGSQAVVGTLWPASDVHAHRLVRQFYRRLDQGPARALALAQRGMIERSRQGEGWEDRVGGHPAFFGPYVLMGLP